MILGHVQDDVAGLVEAAGLVGVQLAGGPALVGPGFPFDGRATRVDAAAETVQSSRSSTAQDGTASDRPTSRASPTRGLR